jgi:putative transcriptional regulator
MGKKLTGNALANFEAKRNVWQEVLDGVREVKAGKGKQTNVEAKSYVVCVRLMSGLSKAKLAVALGVSKAWSNESRAGANRPAPQRRTSRSTIAIRKSALRLQCEHPRSTPTGLSSDSTNTAETGHT